MSFISRCIKRNAKARLADVRAVKSRLNALGYEGGEGPYPDEQLFKSIRAFQGDNALKTDGVITPKGETAQALTDRLGTHYIWKTSGDSKVRSAHAQRDGKMFSWDNPPEGGHPGETHNCRCVADIVVDNDCTKLIVKIKNKELFVRNIENNVEQYNRLEKDEFNNMRITYDELVRVMMDAGIDMALSLIPFGKVPVLNLAVSVGINAKLIYDAYDVYKQYVMRHRDAFELRKYYLKQLALNNNELKALYKERSSQVCKN